MSTLRKISLLAFVCLLPFLSYSQTAGQVMFVGYNSDGNGFAFVALVDLPNGTNIYFNDNEWSVASSTFNNSSEGEMTWTNNTGVTIRGGSVITINPGVPSATLGGIAGDAISLGSAGEVLYMFLGSSATVPTTFLSAIANNTFSAGSGELPATLTSGTNAIQAGAGDLDVWVYNGAIEWNSTTAAAATALSNAANWISDSNGASDDTDGVAPDFPTNVPCNFSGSIFTEYTYYTRADGAWDANTTWTLTADGSGSAVLANEWPRRTDNVVILNGHTVTVNADTDNLPKNPTTSVACGAGVSPNSLGLANVGNGGDPFTGSGDAMFYHTGDILIDNGGELFNSTAGAEMMFAGYTLVESGGELDVTDDLINLGYLEIASGAIADFGDDLILSGSSTTIINNTSTGTDDIYIEWTNATLCGNGVMNLGNGGPDPTVQFFNTATAAQICSYFSITCTATCGGFSSGPPSGVFFVGKLGPGGVGDQDINELWLKADDLSQSDGTAVTSWPDFSGNSLAATQGTAANQPVFNTNDVNGVLPSISFDGLASPNGDFLNLGTPAGLNLIPGTDSWSFFIVYNTPDLEQGTFFAKCQADGPSRQYQYTIDDNVTSRFTAYIGGNPTIGNIASTNGWFLSSCITTTTQKDSWTNEDVNFSAQGIGAGQVQTTEVLIGARRDSGPTTGTGFELQGSIAEIAMYSAITNTAQRIIVSNYLAAKYSIALLPANDIYTGDDAPGNFDFEMAGIGQASDGSRHIDAKGSGMVRMWNPSALANSDFLLWGHDNGALSGTTSGVDGIIVRERLTRSWQVSETADVGTVSISFDISSLDNPLGENLRLLIDRDADGFADNDVAPISGSFATNAIVFSGVNFVSGDRFTLGNTDLANPLPIQLASFKAETRDQTVLLSWSTLTEINNDFFTIERSKDAKIWEEVLRKPGAGNSKVRMNYSTTDDGPYQGVSYYRLKQTDFDGRSTYAKPKRVVVEYTGEISIYPNPFDDSFVISAPFELMPHQVKLYDITGKLVSFVWDEENSNSKIKIRATSIPPGIYLLRASDGIFTQTIRVVRR